MRRADPFILCTALAALILAAAPSPARASVVIDDDLSGGLLDPLALAESLAGAGVSVSNATYVGDPSAAGVFSGGSATVGLESGVILSAGRVADVVGPNDAPDTTTSFFTPGDPDLAALAGVSLADTFDAAVLAFDFVPSGDEVKFRYVFVSEEYNEFSNDIFNNVFGFFINGTNYALVPGSGISVSINNVNGGQPDECFNGLDDDLDGRVDAADPDCTTPGDNIVGENNQNSALFINND
ncbi:MAG: choice-of-anchor L domain-containing protein, partial [Deltaproteobacteria bacterium]